MLLIICFFNISLVSAGWGGGKATPAAQTTPVPPSLFPDDLVGESDRIDDLPGVKWGNNLEENFMPAVMKFITGSVGGVALVVLLVSGFMMITSFDDSEMREKAKKTLYWAMLGIVFIMLAYAIVKGITNIQFWRS